MFEYLKGEVAYKKPEYLALDVNGVGYKIYISLTTYDSVETGDIKRFFIYNHIKEEEFKLVGFLEERERNLFEMLLSVKGIGVSLALAIMSTFDMDTFRGLVLQENYIALKKVPKLGEKKAQQIILDLKDKMKKLDIVSMEKVFGANASSNVEDELIMALEGLGYNKKDIDKLLDKNEIRNYKNIQEAIKETLKKIQNSKN